MNLHLVNDDATNVAADVQFVKHFSGLIGGAEGAWDRLLGGKVRKLLNSNALDSFGEVQLLRVANRTRAKAKNLLILGLGPISSFSLQNLQTAMVTATREALRALIQISSSTREVEIRSSIRL